MRCAIWDYLYNFKNVKNILRGYLPALTMKQRDEPASTKYPHLEKNAECF